MQRTLLSVMLCLIFLTLPVANVQAVGTWTGGQDTLHVPVSWCVVQGSPAQAAPNVAGDTTTNALIWRRHERPTDNIFVNPSGIAFRSAINSVWGTVNYPIIADPDTTVGQPGDMRGEDVNVNGVEFNTLVNNCDTAWSNLGRAGIGITAVNAGLFHDASANYVGVIGWGGCTESTVSGNCVAPFDGRVVVIDNNYLFPSVADRTFPPSPADPLGNLRFGVTDPFDQLVGHEFGHALSLNHRTAVGALMNPGQQDNNGDSNADNIGLNAAEVTALRTNAQNVPGLERDPPGVFLPGQFVVTRMVDQVGEDQLRESPAYFDLASVKVNLNKESKEIGFDQQLFGLLPEEGGAMDFWYMLDADGSEQGLQPEQLLELGLPESRFVGADLVVRAHVENRQVKGEGWWVRDGELIKIDDRILFELQTLILHPHFSPLPGGKGTLPKDIAYPVHDIVNIRFPLELLNLELGKPFHLQTASVVDGERIVDGLGIEEEKGVEFILEDPSFPHCFVQEDGTPGSTVKIVIEDLRADAPIHGLLGPELVFQGKSDETGGGTIEFPIPADVVAGFHLVTIGVDDTALTADCVIQIVGGKEWDPEQVAWLKGYEALLLSQQRIMEQLGRLIDALMTKDGITPEQLVPLTEEYQRLVAEQAELLKRYEEMGKKMFIP